MSKITSYIKDDFKFFKVFSRESGPSDPNSVANRHCILLTCAIGSTFNFVPQHHLNILETIQPPVLPINTCTDDSEFMDWELTTSKFLELLSESVRVRDMCCKSPLSFTKVSQ